MLSAAFIRSIKSTGYRPGCLGIFVIYVLFALASCRTDAPYHEIIRNESYGSDARNNMDVFLPANRDSNTEMVILIHGGAWVAGDKSDFSNSTFTGRLLQKGFAVASINYRYACGDFRKQMDDIGTAIQHIRSKAGNWNIAGSRFALLGGSAGGHLALLYGHAFDTMRLVKAIVSIVGPTDLTDTLFHRYASHYGIAYVFEQFLGTTLQGSYQVYRDASPIFNAANVPSLFIYGKRDDLIPYQHGTRMHDVMNAAGYPCDLLLFENAGHNVFGDKNENAEQIFTKVTGWMLLYLNTQ